MKLEGLIYCTSLLLYISYVLTSALSINNKTAEPSSRVYKLIYNDEIGCSYVGAWLSHINLFRKIPYWVDISRAEAASTEVYNRLPNKYLFKNFDAHYVNHLSMFEHLNSNKYGFSEAQRKSRILAQSAFEGECGAIVAVNMSQIDLTSIAIVPFYGGLPPNGTSHLSDSLGQGNSKVDEDTKALQCLATVCSCLRYFGHVFIGISRAPDRALLINKLNFPFASGIRSRVTIVEFTVSRPIVQVFHLLVWTQHYLKLHNCAAFQVSPSSATNLSDSQRKPSEKGRSLKKVPWWKGKLKRLYFNDSLLNIDQNAVRRHKASLSAVEAAAYDICSPLSIQHSLYAVAPLNVTHIHYFDPLGTEMDIRHHKTMKRVGEIGGYEVHAVHSHPIRYIYYTEADQIVRFDSLLTAHAIKAASNATTYFLGRRRDKARDSDPVDYMGSLSRGSHCGRTQEMYMLDFPKSSLVYRVYN